MRAAAAKVSELHEADITFDQDQFKRDLFDNLKTVDRLEDPLNMRCPRGSAKRYRNDWWRKEQKALNDRLRKNKAWAGIEKDTIRLLVYMFGFRPEENHYNKNTDSVYYCKRDDMSDSAISFTPQANAGLLHVDYSKDREGYASQIYNCYINYDSLADAVGKACGLSDFRYSFRQGRLPYLSSGYFNNDRYEAVIKINRDAANFANAVRVMEKLSAALRKKTKESADAVKFFDVNLRTEPLRMLNGRYFYEIVRSALKEALEKEFERRVENDETADFLDINARVDLGKMTITPLLKVKDTEIHSEWGRISGKTKIIELNPISIEDYRDELSQFNLSGFEAESDKSPGAKFNVCLPKGQPVIFNFYSWGVAYEDHLKYDVLIDWADVQAGFAKIGSAKIIGVSASHSSAFSEILNLMGIEKSVYCGLDIKEKKVAVMRAYVAMSLKYHPDVAEGQARREGKYLTAREIKEATEKQQLIVGYRNYLLSLI